MTMTVAPALNEIIESVMLDEAKAITALRSILENVGLLDIAVLVADFHSYATVQTDERRFIADVRYILRSDGYEKNIPILVDIADVLEDWLEVPPADIANDLALLRSNEPVEYDETIDVRLI